MYEPGKALVSVHTTANHPIRVPVYIRLVLEIYRWPRGLSSLIRVSTRRDYFTALTVDRNIATNHMLF